MRELDDDVKANAMRHMMAKEILEAVDLQPQYRTFSEIRDYMLQQARQRADVFVGDGCHPTKNFGNVTSRASTNTPTTTKATTPVPMDVSQMSSNALKNESGNQENDTYQHELDQDGEGDELYAVKGKGKGGFQGTCFKCGMRGHKADRCWQKGNGKGGKGEWETGKDASKGKGWPKGKWSNSCYTWDNSWHSSNWHGKTYDLEVDPWAAAEPVPYLCAISLKSSDEEFSEPKHVFRERERDKPRSYHVPRNLHMRIDSRVLRKVKMNFPSKIALQCTRQMLSANSGSMNEVMDALQTRVH